MRFTPPGIQRLSRSGSPESCFWVVRYGSRSSFEKLKDTPLLAGKTSLMISPRHEEARKMASAVRERLKAEGAIGFENHPVSVLRRMDLGPESCRDLLHYVPGRVGAPRRNQSGTCFF